LLTFAYCATSFAKSVRKAAGVAPLLSPPYHHGCFKPAWLERQDFIYFKLHGFPSQPYWYGENWTTALSLSQIEQADLTGSVIFVANCHGATQTGKPDVMVQALLDAGAVAVAAGPGVNWAPLHRVGGADLLGHNFRRFLGLSLPPLTAFQFAMARVKHKDKHTKRLNTKDHQATKDTLTFKLFLQEKYT